MTDELEVGEEGKLVVEKVDVDVLSKTGVVGAEGGTGAGAKVVVGGESLVAGDISVGGWVDDLEVG